MLLEPFSCGLAEAVARFGHDYTTPQPCILTLGVSELMEMSLLAIDHVFYLAHSRIHKPKDIRSCT